MSSSRDQRVAHLTAAARRKSDTKTRDAETAIGVLVQRGEAITFQAVQREAGVSHAFLYNHPVLRDRIEQLRRGPRTARPQPAPTDRNDNFVIALTAEIARLKKDLHEQTTALRKALAQAHGENLDLRRELTRRGQVTAQPS